MSRSLLFTSRTMPLLYHYYDVTFYTLYTWFYISFYTRFMPFIFYFTLHITFYYVLYRIIHYSLYFVFCWDLSLPLLCWKFCMLEVNSGCLVDFSTLHYGADHEFPLDLEWSVRRLRGFPLWYLSLTKNDALHEASLKQYNKTEIKQK
jgi:hypothetical protein